MRGACPAPNLPDTSRGVRGVGAGGFSCVPGRNRELAGERTPRPQVLGFRACELYQVTSMLPSIMAAHPTSVVTISRANRIGSEFPCFRSFSSRPLGCWPCAGRCFFSPPLLQRGARRLGGERGGRSSKLSAFVGTHLPGGPQLPALWGGSLRDGLGLVPRRLEAPITRTAVLRRTGGSNPYDGVLAILPATLGIPHILRAPRRREGFANTRGRWDRSQSKPSRNFCCGDRPASPQRGWGAGKWHDELKLLVGFGTTMERR